jgi:hypothetical protein
MRSEPHREEMEPVMGLGTAIGGTALGMDDHDWWRRQAGDIETIASRVGGSSRRWTGNLVEWSGVSWDGTSALRVGTEEICGPALVQLLSRLRHDIQRLEVPFVTAPRLRDVRVCLAGSYERESLILDVDFHNFILPIAVDGHAFGGSAASLDLILEGVMRQIDAAARVRRGIARREAALRAALMTTSTRIRGECAPLWLRMDPVPADRRPDPPLHRYYKMVTTLLDDSLSPSPSPPEAIWTVADIRDHWRLHGHVQQRRTAARTSLRVSGSIGAMTETSLALVRAAGLEPFATTEAARVARIKDADGGLGFRGWGCQNILNWVEGVLRTSIRFEQGRYDDGGLTLYGDYPASLALGSEGRQLTTIMDHPAFRTADCRILSAVVTEGEFQLRHHDRVIPLERVAGAKH